MMKCDLLIFGATRNTGLLIAQQARAKNLTVAAMVRPSGDPAALQEIGAHTIAGDAFELADCQNALKQTQPCWVVSVLGGKNPQGRRIDATGNINIIKAAQNHSSIERFVLMTSMGCGEQYENTNEQVKKFLGEALRAKTEAENLLRESTLPWTILRPGGLNNDPFTGKYHLVEQPEPQYSSYLPRADVAAATLQLLEESNWLHRIMTVQGDYK